MLNKRNNKVRVSQVVYYPCLKEQLSKLDSKNLIEAEVGK